MTDRRRRAARRAIALVATLVVLGACGEGVPDIDTTDARRTLDAVVEAAGFPERGTFIELDRCPIDDADVVIDQLFGSVGGTAIDAALEASTSAFVSAPNERVDADPYLACGRLDPQTGSGVVLLVADAPGPGLVDPDTAPDDLDVAQQWDDIANSYALRFGDLSSNVDIGRLRDTRGGTLYRICIAEPDVAPRDSCEATWFGGDLVVAAVVTGTASLDADTTALGDELRRRLQLVVDGLSIG